MKYLKSYNESIRDKMTPKTEDDILNLNISIKKDIVHDFFIGGNYNKKDFLNYIKTHLSISTYNRINKLNNWLQPYTMIQKFLTEHEIDEIVKSSLKNRINESIRDQMN